MGSDMERVPYRRYRGQEIRHEREKSALGETLLLQGIISGIILIAVLLISIITFVPLAPLQNALYEALAGPITVAELAGELGLLWPGR
jgi:hypothetical protein